MAIEFEVLMLVPYIAIEGSSKTGPNRSLPGETIAADNAQHLICM